MLEKSHHVEASPQVVRKLKSKVMNHFDPVVGWTGLATLCSALVQYFSNRRSELWSEMVCWIALPFMIHARTALSTKEHGIDWVLSGPRLSLPTGLRPQLTSSSISLWVVAVCLGVVALFKAEYETVLGYFPALVPLLLAAQKYFDIYHGYKPVESSLFAPLINTIPGTGFVAAISLLTLSDWQLWENVESLLPVVALLIVYVALTPKVAKESGPVRVPHIQIDQDISSLSLRMVIVMIVALGVEITAFNSPRTGSMTFLMFLLGIVKALAWFSLIQATRHVSWNIAPVIGTFSIMATRNPYLLTSNSQALSHVATSGLALGQIFYSMPRAAKTRWFLSLFILASLIPYASNLHTIRSAESWASRTFDGNQEHPVATLVRQAKEDFISLQERQSQNYTAAHAEYKRRYNIEPPPGFEAWYEFAVAHDSPLIDDFDMIFDQVSPFLRISGRDVDKMMNDVQNAPRSEVWVCKYAGDMARTRCTHRKRTYDRHIELTFNKLMGNITAPIPDIKFLVNHLDEPTLLVPPGSGSHDEGIYTLTKMSKQPIWDAVTGFCQYQQNTKGPWMKKSVETYGLPFVTDTSSAKDLCHHPEYRNMHGFLMSPPTFRLIEGSIPILSTGSVSTMGDVLYPSPAYMESEFQYDETHDTDWEHKRNNLYWAGSTTGGYAQDGRWRDFHRQRFVERAKNLQTRKHYYLRENQGVVSRIASTFMNSRLFDVAFTRLLHCKEKFCSDQEAYFDVKSWVDKDRALQSQLVFDLDGNGISGRYYKLLASKSTPLKQTLFREWHDERLVPWLHYIPVSQSLDELPEMVLYLTSTEAGQKVAREVAEQGRNWVSKAFREVDMTIYTWRLLLELARLQDPERRAFNEFGNNQVKTEGTAY